jgi:hypothetical protein
MNGWASTWYVLPMSWTCALPARRLLVTSVLVLASVLVSFAPGAAHGQAGQTTDRSDLIRSGKEMFEDQRYEESIQTLSAALLRPATSKVDRIDVYRYLAFNYLVLSQMEEAEAAVRGLYVLDPGFTLAETESPRFRTFFAEVRQRWEEEGRPGLVDVGTVAVAPPSIKHISPAEWERGKPVPITGQVVDPNHRIASVVVHYRTGSRGKFRQLEARHSQGAFRASIPGAALNPPLVEYYIEAVDDARLPIASRGDAAAPLRIAVPGPDQGTSVLASPWFWVAAAVVVAGGVTGAILLGDSSSESSPPPNNQPPTSRVIVVIGN